MLRKVLNRGLLHKSGCLVNFGLRARSDFRAATMSGLPWVSVFTSESDDRLQISFTHPGNAVKQRTYNFSRAKDELLQMTLARMAANVSKFVNKKKIKKRKKNLEENAVDSNDDEKNGTDLNIRMYRDGLRLSEDMLNEAAWVNHTFLEVDGTQYEIYVNPPVCRSITLSLSSNIMQGFLIYPEIDIAWCSLRDCQYSWQRTEEDDVEMTTTGASKSTEPQNKWIEISTEPYYCPTTADVGKNIKLVITPIRDEIVGIPLESHSFMVQAGPTECLFDKRQRLTTERCTNGRFRFVSYNILADLYGSSDYSEKVLYPYCRPEFREFSYRKQLISKEILGYNADIVCLQEVDQKFYIGSLSGIMESQGYGGLFNSKPGEVAEGTATFYKKDRFREVASHDIDMMDAFRTDPVYTNILEKVNAVEPLAEIVHGRKTEVQVTVLESIDEPKKKLLVATTHLYYHPIANNVRMIQTIIALLHIEKVKKMYRDQGEEVAVIFCGDFNAGPISGSVQLITRGSVPSTHANWWSAGRDQLVTDLHLKHSLRLSSACGYPEYTNYVGAFHGCLDYIFIEDDHLVSERIIPLPDHDDIVRYTALPNEAAPSDHLAVVCDIAWKH